MEPPDTERIHHLCRWHEMEVFVEEPYVRDPIELPLLTLLDEHGLRKADIEETLSFMKHWAKRYVDPEDRTTSGVFYSCNRCPAADRVVFWALRHGEGRYDISLLASPDGTYALFGSETTMDCPADQYRRVPVPAYWAVGFEYRISRAVPKPWRGVDSESEIPLLHMPPMMTAGIYRNGERIRRTAWERFAPAWRKMDAACDDMAERFLKGTRTYRPRQA